MTLETKNPPDGERPDGERPDGERIAALRDRLLFSPQDAGSMAELACLLEAAGDLPASIDLYQRALRVDPYQIDIILALARCWSLLGDGARAGSWFNRALAIDPDCADATKGLAQLADGAALTPAYVRTLFDQYAGRFDRELTGTLNYRAPQLVSALLEHRDIADGTVEILDLGCGTGLSGQALLRFARQLDGVDLSPGMVEQARRRGIYDTLAVDGAVDFLNAAERTWDVIAAVDMLNYIGDLTEVFSAAAARLSARGILAGTVEKGEVGVALTGKRRYVHGVEHLREAIAAAGLTVLELVEETLRTEGGSNVAGLIFLAGRAPRSDAAGQQPVS